MSAGSLFTLSILVAVIGLMHYRFQTLAPGHLLPFQLLSALCVGGYFLAMRLIPVVMPMCIKNDLWGKDINKNTDAKVFANPESMGTITGSVYLIVVVLAQPLFASMLGQYNAALISICWMIFLGFIDDVLDLRWAVKIGLSFLATLPLLVSYSGPSNIIVPKPLRDLLGTSVYLGFGYHAYMMLIAVFCTNSINIYAGINGLEVSQSIVVCIAVLVHNFIELGGSCPEPHMLSIWLMLPFLAVSLALIYYNWYPSAVFVGDSFTYFAGMALAVAGIQGHFSKTLLLFFAPQLINFTLSLPQLFRIIPCPRHRVPKLVPATGLLRHSYADEDTKKIPNLTLINAFLWVFGHTHEQTLTIMLTIFHVLCCVAAFTIRYSEGLTSTFYDKVNMVSC